MVGCVGSSVVCVRRTTRMSIVERCHGAGAVVAWELGQVECVAT
jgi:hypothetical protein